MEEGHRFKYARLNYVVTPILTRISKRAKDWTRGRHGAWFTAMIGSTQMSKPRLLMELSHRIRVVYICLRPPNFDGYPPRSSLANQYCEISSLSSTDTTVIVVAILPRKR
ncbi:hypothetical protein Pst134EB_022309 [Puccinia striiformis f. sp. tritici]|nr:hypothetical protein Pst134EB_022309 [Puccinia striiformis f. sp. tritici]